MNLKEDLDLFLDAVNDTMKVFATTVSNLRGGDTVVNEYEVANAMYLVADVVRLVSDVCFESER